MTTRLVMALRRVGGGLVVVWVSATIAFLAVRLVPGDPVDTMLGIHAQVSDHIKDGIRADLGLDRPLYEQYALFLGRLLRGDLGTSYQLRKPVTEVLGEQLGSTLQLTGLAMAIAIVCQRAGAEHRPGIREPAGARRELSYHSVRTL